MSKIIDELRVMATSRTSGVVDRCLDRIAEGGEDSLFFQAVLNLLQLASAESEAEARLQEAQVWISKWRPSETQEATWASERITKLHHSLESRKELFLAAGMTREMAETISTLGSDDPRVPLIEAKFFWMPLADLKVIARATLKRE